ncbi:hypothetical protein D3C78_1272110 [compost metagenome]
MSKVIDLTGKRFERWIVLELSHQKGKMLYWKCRCDCGNERAVFGADLKRGISRSCGCLAYEERKQRMRKHGHFDHPAYGSWKKMRYRCLDPRDDSFKEYGGRGITICHKWLAFDGFWEDMGPTWFEGSSIDRIDTDGNYQPDNCRWATPKQQANNRRTNVMVTLADGRRMTITEACEVYGISRRAVYSRKLYGWPESDWFKPTRKRK